MWPIYLHDVETANRAVEALKEVLVRKGSEDPRIPVFEHDTAMSDGCTMEFRYRAFEDVTLQVDSIVLDPGSMPGLHYHLPVNPLVHKDQAGNKSRHMTEIMLQGDFLAVAVPYYFYVDKIEVSWRHYGFFLNNGGRLNNSRQ